MVLKKYVLLLLIFFVMLGLGSPAKAAQNLLVNGDFEQASPGEKPAGWLEDFARDGYEMVVTDELAYLGRYSLKIRLNDPNDARMIQTVAVKPNTYYRLSGWIAVKDVPADNVGANLCLMGGYDYSAPLNGNSDWTYAEFNFRTHPSQTGLTIGARLGMFCSDNTGVAYFDALALDELNEPPLSYRQLTAPAPPTAAAVSLAGLPKADPKFWFWVFFGGVVLLNSYFSWRKRFGPVAPGKSGVAETEPGRENSLELEQEFVGKIYDRKILERISIKQVILWSVLILGIAVRVWEFGSIPPGINQDEASIGYDTFALVNFGIDRNGQSFPVHFIAWGSGQNALYAYLIMPFVKIFGLSETTTRLGNLLFGLIALVFLYKLIRRFANFELAWLATFILAISPWGIISSRWGLEGNILPALILIGIYFYLIAFDKPYYLPLSFGILGISLYSYGTTYFVIPLLLLGMSGYWFFIHRKEPILLKSLWQAWGIFIIIAIPIMLFVIINFTKISGSINLWFLTVPRLTTTGARYAQTVIFNPDLTNLTSLIAKITQYLGYYYETVFKQQGAIWNVINPYGNLYSITNWFFGIGFIAALFEVVKNFRSKQVDYKLLFILWFLASTLLGIIFEINTNRINVIFIPMIFFASYGIYRLAGWLGRFAACLAKNHIKQITLYTPFKMVVIILIIAVYLGQFSAFSKVYFTEYPSQIGIYFQDSFRDALKYANEKFQGRVTYVSDFTMSYIYVLFYQRYNPRDFLSTVVYHDPNADFRTVRSFGNYRFVGINNGYQPIEEGVYLVENEKVAFLQNRPFKSLKQFRRFSVVEF